MKVGHKVRALRGPGLGGGGGGGGKEVCSIRDVM